MEECVGFSTPKRKFASKREANEHLVIMKQQHPEFPWRAFKCHYCHSWHVGRVHGRGRRKWSWG